MTRTKRLALVMTLCLFMISIPPAAAAPERDPVEGLPEAVAGAVRRAFPNAAVVQVGRERERGVMLYEVTLREEDKESELEVTADGVIGEIESVVDLGELPEDVAGRIRRVTKGGRISLIERHERRAEFRSGRAVPLRLPTVTYEITYYRGGKRHYAAVISDELGGGPRLPHAVRRVIEERFPDAAVGQVEREYALGIALYEVELDVDGSEVEALISGDGVLIEVESEIEEARAPAAVTRALKELVGDRPLGELQKVDVHAVARLEPLDATRTVYEAEWEVDGEDIEAIVTVDGTVLVMEKEEEKDDDDE